jgi:hypothetical protein
MYFQNDFAVKVYHKIIHWFVEEFVGILDIVLINGQVVCDKYC